MRALRILLLVVAAGCTTGCEPGPGSDAGQAPAEDMTAEDTPAYRCGDGKRDPGEECDAKDLNGQTCKGLGFKYGALSCTDQCILNRSACANAICGDGVAEDTEECDGKDLDGLTCKGLGWQKGQLGCTGACRYDYSSCYNPGCGNNRLDPGEDCDGANLGGKSCKTLGYLSGTLGCSATCKLDKTGCVLSICGNGKKEGNEQCDVNDLGGQSCQKVGYKSGVLSCQKGCKFNTKGCVPFPCGDGKKNVNEQCDGADLGGQTCQTQGFYSPNGKLTCAKGCTLNTTGCVCKKGSQSPPPHSRTDSATVNYHDKGTTICESAFPLKMIPNNPRLAVGAKEQVHLLYAKDLLLVSRSSGKWQKVQLDQGATWRCRALAVDAAGKVHIALADPAKGIFYMTGSGGTWSKVQLFKGKVGCGLSVAAAQGTVAVAHSTGGSAIKLRYAARTGGKWSAEDAAQGLTSPTLLIGSSGGPVIVAGGAPGVSVLTRSAGKWAAKKMDSSKEAPMAAMDQKGALHLLYNVAGPSAIHATNATGAWIKTTALTGARATAFALDAGGKAYLAYIDAKKFVCGGTYCSPTTECGACGWKDYRSFYTSKTYLRTNASGAWASQATGMSNCEKSCTKLPSTGGRYEQSQTIDNSVHGLSPGANTLYMVSVQRDLHSHTGRHGIPYPLGTYCLSVRKYKYRFKSICW